MNKIDTYTLDNGLRVFLYNDNSKHCTLASLFIKFGGINKKIYIDDNEYIIKDGTAHFMEHLLYEHSMYGESDTSFWMNHTYSNASTNKDYTRFYINSVHNFNDDLIKLINTVNNPSFLKENIEEVRSAIIKEKMMSKDNKFTKLNRVSHESLFKDIKYPNVLGEIEDINNISYEDIKICYESFYNPNNQILCIAGNFNEKEVKKIIDDTYSSINNKYLKYELPQINEPDEINVKDSFVYEKTNINYIRVNYKINISHLLPHEKVKLSFYIHYFLGYLFGPDSYIYHKLISEDICSFDIDISDDVINDYLILKIGTFTNEKNKFVSAITNAINSKKIDEKDFELRKKDTIINLILREESLLKLLGPLLDNILTFNYPKFDTVEDINSYTFKDYKNIINILDFSNYNIVEMMDKE